MSEMNQILKVAYKTLDDKLAKDIKILDVRGLTPLADYFIVASGTSERQVSALAQNLEQELAKEDYFVRGREGTQSNTWVLLDFKDIVIHIFKEEERMFYDIEKIWKDAPYVDIDSL